MGPVWQLRFSAKGGVEFRFLGDALGGYARDLLETCVLVKVLQFSVFVGSDDEHGGVAHSRYGVERASRAGGDVGEISRREPSALGALWVH